MMGAAIPPPRELTESPQGNAIPTSVSWGDQLDSIAPLDDNEQALLMEETEFINVVEDEDSGDEPISLGSDEDDEDDLFTPSPAAKLESGGSRCSGSPNPPLSTDLQDVCKRAAAKLGIAWPEAPAETTTSRYEGRRLPRAKPSTRQLLPIFPECLEEATRSWSNPLTAKNLAQGGSALDWEDMEEKGFSRLPPVEPLLASHLHPTQKAMMTAAGPALPSQADCFQSSLTEKGYKAVAMSVRALNASSLLLAYQAELQDSMTASPSAELWEEVCVVTDLCLRLHRCSVQASGRAMAFMVAQERARWLNLSSLSQKEKAQLLDVPVDPKGLFGPAVAIMQKRCEEKRKEGEALQLCLPRKLPPPPPAAPRQMFAQAATRPGFRIPKRQPQVQGAPQGKPPELKGAWARKPSTPSAAQGSQSAPAAPQGGKKKRRA